ncbi:MAG TPA: hypothetical protein PLG50_08515 [bacterium]|mgnify:CR=1 FL=1|nr:hypothetical protein [bacterium]HQG45688.1 hypothetical protein [bacterium]HQI48490.1 hypothetical protein [bacterium]HQJ65784.1 hypothetical protein [bacterium]
MKAKFLFASIFNFLATIFSNSPGQIPASVPKRLAVLPFASLSTDETSVLTAQALLRQALLDYIAFFYRRAAKPAYMGNDGNFEPAVGKLMIQAPHQLGSKDHD